MTRQIDWDLVLIATGIAFTGLPGVACLIVRWVR